MDTWRRDPDIWDPFVAYLRSYKRKEKDEGFPKSFTVDRLTPTVDTMWEMFTTIRYRLKVLTTTTRIRELGTSRSTDQHEHPVNDSPSEG